MGGKGNSCRVFRFVLGIGFEFELMILGRKWVEVLRGCIFVLETSVRTDSGRAGSGKDVPSSSISEGVNVRLVRDCR